MLEIGNTVPSELEMKRWSSELVMAISVGTDKFVTNKENYPVLRKDLQNLIINSFKYKCQVRYQILAVTKTGKNRIPGQGRFPRIRNFLTQHIEEFKK